MNFDDINKTIREFKNSVIENIDFHFNNEIGLDILEAGLVDYIISDYDWYFYWMDKAKELKEFMDRLIEFHYIQKFEKKNEDAANKIWNFLRECVEIKRVIDKNLRENKNFNELEVKDWMGIEVDKELIEKNFIPLLGVYSGAC